MYSREVERRVLRDRYSELIVANVLNGQSTVRDSKEQCPSVARKG